VQKRLKAFTVALISVAISLAVACTHIPIISPARGTIEGVVLAGLMSPVANETVIVSNTRLSAKTDSAGRFVIPRVPAGLRSVELQWDGDWTAKSVTDVPIRHGQRNCVVLNAYRPRDRIFDVITGDTPPMLIIDNVIYIGADIRSPERQRPGGRPEPEDSVRLPIPRANLVSFELLSGASAARLYGRRADSGVYIVRTRAHAPCQE
jgi:hypothetical protein